MPFGTGPSLGKSSQAWQNVTAGSGPQLFIANPTLNSSVPNPFSGTQDFAISADIEYQTTPPGWAGQPSQQVLFASGDNSPNLWSFYFQGSFLANSFIGSAGGSQNPLSAPSGAALVGSSVVGWEPGQHNFAFGKQSGNWVFYVDGALVQSVAVTHSPVQGANLDIGMFLSGTSPVTTYTMKNLRADASISKVLSSSGSTQPTQSHFGGFFGDSITVGYGATNGLGWSQQVLNADYSTRWWWQCAYSGQVASAAANVWSVFGVNQGMDKVVNAIGVNDLLGGSSAATVFAIVQPMLDSMRTSGVGRIVLNTITPFGTNASSNPTKVAARNTYNGLLVTYAASFPTIVKIADVAAAVADPMNTDNLAAAYDSGDGLHPNQSGYNVMYPVVSAQL